ncbi:MAG: hypothetical protein M3125_05385 [Gemmatimonadota bacterium]|nr:hypothetical protein [Gemmatimonadota bacterium]
MFRRRSRRWRFIASVLPLLSACVMSIARESSLEPVGVRLTAVDVSPSHACGISSDGAAFCWGENSNGELGNGSTEYASGIVQVAGGLRFAHISTAFTRTCAVTTRGEGYCWGSNPTGITTRSLKALEESSRGFPVRVAQDLTLAEIHVGPWHACGLTTSGTTYCWGRGGKLGDGSETNSAAPVLVAGGQLFTTLSVGDDHTCGLISPGDAYCWGDGLHGQLGNGRRERSGIPVAVTGGLRFRSINAGEQHTCGITQQGAAYCWGHNVDTQLGVSTAEECGSYPCSTVPLAVSPGLHFSVVSAGKERTCALTTVGEMVCWGDARPGPERIADTTNPALPRPLFPGQRFSALSVSSSKACGVASGGSAYCWRTLAGLPMEPLRMPVPRFVTFAIAGAILGALCGFVAIRVAPHRYGLSAVFGGAGTGAMLGFGLGAAIGLNAFLDMLPW